MIEVHEPGDILFTRDNYGNVHRHTVHVNGLVEEVRWTIERPAGVALMRASLDAQVDCD